MSSSSPNQDEILASLRDFVGAERPDEVRDLQNDDNLFDLGLLDSLQLVSMVVFIESKFGCALGFDDLTEENLGSLSSIRDLILRNTSEVQEFT
jgi:acyl carrier protein